MQICDRLGKRARAALAVAAAFTMLAPSVAMASSHGDTCTDTLKEEYGAVDVDLDRVRSANKHHSVYADARLPDGQTVKFRCLQTESGGPNVQAYVPGQLGTAASWPHWTDASAFRSPPRAGDAVDAAKANPEAAAPAPWTPPEFHPAP